MAALQSTGTKYMLARLPPEQVKILLMDALKTAKDQGFSEGLMADIRNGLLEDDKAREILSDIAVNNKPFKELISTCAESIAPQPVTIVNFGNVEAIALKEIYENHEGFGWNILYDVDRYNMVRAVRLILLIEGHIMDMVTEYSSLQTKHNALCALADITFAVGHIRDIRLIQEIKAHKVPELLIESMTTIHGMMTDEEVELVIDYMQASPDWQKNAFLGKLQVLQQLISPTPVLCPNHGFSNSCDACAGDKPWGANAENPWFRLIEVSILFGDGSKIHYFHSLLDNLQQILATLLNSPTGPEGELLGLNIRPEDGVISIFETLARQMEITLSPRTRFETLRNALYTLIDLGYIVIHGRRSYSSWKGFQTHEVDYVITDIMYRILKLSIMTEEVRSKFRAETKLRIGFRYLNAARHWDLPGLGRVLKQFEDVIAV